MLLLALFCLAGCATATPAVPPVAKTAPPYDYPLDNPYAATIIGTPAAMKQTYMQARQPAERRLVVFPDRKIPEGFWYDRAGLQYGEMLQAHAAPLVYIVGGTGSGYNSKYTIALANMLFQAGNHVVLLPSPTFSNFIVTASTDFFPGNGAADAGDLYRVIGLIQQRLAKKIAITSTGITGFSLGAWQVAFVARLDSREKKIGFRKVLLLNPPLSLYNSLGRLDTMLYAGLPDGINGLDQFINASLGRLSRISSGTDALDFENENLLLDAYLRLKPPDTRMKTVIGLAFRLSAANMIFTADVMSRSGYIYPKDKPFLSTTPMDDYLAIALRTGFADYFRDMYRPHFIANGAAGIPIDQDSLATLRDWITGNPDIGLITNRDDIILGPGELAGLQQLFAGKAYVFPTGGHLGNLEHPAYAWRVMTFFGAPQ